MEQVSINLPDLRILPKNIECLIRKKLLLVRTIRRSTEGARKGQRERGQSIDKESQQSSLSPFLILVKFIAIR